MFIIRLFSNCTIYRPRHLGDCSTFSSVNRGSLLVAAAAGVAVADTCVTPGCCLLAAAAIPLMPPVFELFEGAALSSRPRPLALLILDINESSVPASLILDESNRALNDAVPFAGALIPPDALLPTTLEEL